MRFELAGGWHLLRVEVSGRHEWIICDPIGDCLGNTDKHKAEFDAAMMSTAPASTSTNAQPARPAPG